MTLPDIFIDQDTPDNMYKIANLDSSSIEIISQTFVDHADKKGIILLASHYEPNIKDLEIFNLN